MLLAGGHHRQPDTNRRCGGDENNGGGAQDQPAVALVRCPELIRSRDGAHVSRRCAVRLGVGWLRGGYSAAQNGLGAVALWSGKRVVRGFCKGTRGGIALDWILGHAARDHLIECLVHPEALCAGT